MVSKSVARRTLHALAGKRLPLPGQSPLNEQRLRAALADMFGPRNVIEMMWVNDIAYCMAVIELMRAQIAALRLQQVKEAYTQLAPSPGFEKLKHLMTDTAQFSEGDWDMLEQIRTQRFATAPGESLLDKDVFAALLARFNAPQSLQLSMLQRELREEMRERDRLIGQVTKGRRETARHCVEMVEAHERAKREGYVIAGLREHLEAEATMHGIALGDLRDAVVGEDLEFEVVEVEDEPAESDS